VKSKALLNQTPEHADFAIDRSLDPRHFREAIDFSPPELAGDDGGDPTPLRSLVISKCFLKANGYWSWAALGWARRILKGSKPEDVKRRNTRGARRG
jgi:hypothetical protein